MAPLARGARPEVKLRPAGARRAGGPAEGDAGAYVVAGHSNTTPQLVAALGGEPGEPINESYEFDRLYQVVIGKDGSVTTTLLRYGPISGS